MPPPPLGTRRCSDIESTLMTLIKCRDNVVCLLGKIGSEVVVYNRGFNVRKVDNFCGPLAHTCNK